MESAKLRAKKSHIIIPVFFLVLGGLTLMFIGMSYIIRQRKESVGKEDMNVNVGYSTLASGICLTALGFIYGQLMILLLPLGKRIFNSLKDRYSKRRIAQAEGVPATPEETLFKDDFDVEQKATIRRPSEFYQQPQPTDEQQGSPDAKDVNFSVQKETETKPSSTKGHKAHQKTTTLPPEDTGAAEVKEVESSSPPKTKKPIYY